METAGSNKVSGLPFDSSADANARESAVGRHSRGALALPEQPLAVVQPSGPWRVLDLRDLWRYRELLYFLVWRDLKVRYKQTVMGVLWVIAQPLLSTIIFTIFLGMLVRVPSGDVPYPVFVFAGLLPWSYFSGAVIGGGMSLASNAHLITKVYFPRVLIPAAVVGARLVDFLIAFTILAGLMAFYRVTPGVGALALAPLILLLTLLALGCGLLLSAVNVKYRDVGVALPVLIQLWMFVSPVLYPSDLVPQEWQRIYELNPVVGLVENFRAALFGTPFNLRALAATVAATLIILALSLFVFKRTERDIADII